MNTANYNHSLQTLHKAYEERVFSPREFLTACRKRILSESENRAWINVISEPMLEAFLEKLEKPESFELPLRGVPFAMKDNIDCAGFPTTAGCPAYSYEPAHSAHVVQKCIDAGAVPMGKTNMDQFATGLVGTRSPHGTAVNPHDPERIPGGSSSGSAVAVAQKQVCFALGTDTAGSGRVPAALNHLCALKPSRGLLSTRGVVPACRSLDCVSLFGHDNSDLLRICQLIGEYDPLDPFARKIQPRTPPTSRTLGVPQKGDLFWFSDVDYATAWHQALETLKQAGWEIKPIDYRPFLQAARLLYEGPWIAERYAAIQPFCEEQASAMHPITRDIILKGKNPKAWEYFRASEKLHILKRNVEHLMTDLAALVLPTTGGWPTIKDVEAEPFLINTQLGYYTNFLNLLDLCAVVTPTSNPTETNSSATPFGLTWCAPTGSESFLSQLK